MVSQQNLTSSLPFCLKAVSGYNVENEEAKQNSRYSIDISEERIHFPQMPACVEMKVLYQLWQWYCSNYGSGPVARLYSAPPPPPPHLQREWGERLLYFESSYTEQFFSFMHALERAHTPLHPTIANLDTVCS